MAAELQTSTCSSDIFSKCHSYRQNEVKEVFFQLIFSLPFSNIDELLRYFPGYFNLSGSELLFQSFNREQRNYLPL